MITSIKNPFNLDVIHEQLKKIDDSIILFRGYGVVNFYSERHKYSIAPTVDLEQGKCVFELVVPNGYVGNEIFVGTPDECTDWIRENLNDAIAMSNFAGRVGTREDYLIAQGENPAEAAEFEPTVESEANDEMQLAAEVYRPELV